MRVTMKAAVAAILVLCGCNAPTAQQPQANFEANQAEENVALAPEPAANTAAPAANASLPEPNGPIDPTSVEAAGQVVQHYGALIEQKRWPESWQLWSAPDQARQFDRNWRDFAEIHLEIGEPGKSEGAAGSIYTSVPIVFYGRRNDGRGYRERAEVTLRRVNDVDGSTDAQRRWHIDRINFFRI